MKSISVLLAGALVVGLTASPAEAKRYRNCAELNAKYPGGVARKGAMNVGGETKQRPYYNTKLYLENKGRDRDKDGVACEK